MTDLVYFSSVSENTRRFVERMGLPALRIPLRPRLDGMLHVDRPYVLITPTYGSGDDRGSVPRQVATFLNHAPNRSLLRGVIAAGNTNFGEAYCLAGKVISAKCRVPQLYRFELIGTDADVRAVTEGLKRFWTRQPALELTARGAPTATPTPTLRSVNRRRRSARGGIITP